MCGIFGYIGEKQALPILLEGLSHLEYRGYDSAGVACVNGDGLSLFLLKEKGKLEFLRQRASGAVCESSIGVGHTRWATHGEPSETNAHPHVDCRNRLALVHNGIIENHESLRERLKQKGHRFRSQTDTEVLVHLIEEYDRGDIVKAFRQAIREAHGYFAFVLLSTGDPGRLLVFKRSNPLVIGQGRGENFVASDVPALLPYTRDVLFLNDEEYALIERNRIQVFSVGNRTPLRRKLSRIEWSVAEAQKEGFPHFMLKEIYEQPRVLADTLSRHLDPKGRLRFESFEPRVEARLRRIRKIFVVSCGTAYHAGLVGRYMIEEYARIPTEVQPSSEFRYSDPIVGKDDVVVLITQSGETADTLAALREAKAKGAFTLAVVNVVGSTIAREADLVVYTHAGPEIGVASTKAYCAQLMTLVFFALYLAQVRSQIRPSELKSLVEEIRKLPAHARKILGVDSIIKGCVQRYYQRKNFLYLGRGYNFPNALEGALKLKEISYAHAHGYAAGEMKHGPIALIDEELPVLCIAPHSKTYEKMVSNIEEIRARRGQVIAIGTEGDETLKKLSYEFFPIPRVPEILSPILTAVPLQLFAYQVAVMNRRDVDQPRNLAKSVTVE